MSNIQDQVTRLREMLTNCNHFKEIGEAFYDLSEMRSFLDFGSPVESPLITSLLQAGGEAIMGKPVHAASPLCIHVPDFELFHGPCMIETYHGTVFFFEDMGLGLLWIWKSDTGETLFTRISAAMLSGPAFLAHPEEPACD